MPRNNKVTLANSHLLNQSFHAATKLFLFRSKSSVSPRRSERLRNAASVINQSMKWSMGARLGTHWFVSSNRWIFLCSSRLLALHADILRKSRTEERRRNYRWSQRGLLQHPNIRVPPLIQLLFFCSFMNKRLLNTARMITMLMLMSSVWFDLITEPERAALAEYNTGIVCC